MSHILSKIKNFDYKKVSPFTLIVILLFTLSLSGYFWFGFFHLDQFDTADEHLWMISERINQTDSPALLRGRIPQYWIAMANKDWPDTRINDKPGVSLAYVSGLGYLFNKGMPDAVKYMAALYTSYEPAAIQNMILIYRRPTVIFNGLMTIFFLAYLWRLTRNRWLAMLGASSILLSPILLGISQIVNPDTLLWSFSFASVLAFLVFLRDGRFVDAFLSALFLGFALLSKYVALILIPFYFLIVLIYLFFKYTELTEGNVFIRRARQASVGYPLIVAAGIGLYALLMPAMLMNKNLLYAYTFGFGKGAMEPYFVYLGIVNVFLIVDAFIFKAFVTRWLMQKLQILKSILPRVLSVVMLALFVLLLINFNGGNDFLKIYQADLTDALTRSDLSVPPVFIQFVQQAMPVVFSLSPVVLFLILFAWLKSIIKQGPFDHIIFAFSLFFLMYYFAMIKQDVSLNIRYSIMLYPFAITLAAIGFSELVTLFRLKEIYVSVAALAVLTASFVSLAEIKPFYFNYASDLLPKKYSIAKSWGYGGYEAAQFVNSQLEKESVPVVWSDYDGFCPFFRGECLIPYGPKWASDGRLRKIDYYVLTYQGQKKNKPSLAELQRVAPKSELVWELNIDERPDNYVKVYKIIK